MYIRHCFRPKQGKHAALHTNIDVCCSSWQTCLLHIQSNSIPFCINFPAQFPVSFLLPIAVIAIEWQVSAMQPQQMRRIDGYTSGRSAGESPGCKAGEVKGVGGRAAAVHITCNAHQRISLLVEVVLQTQSHVSCCAQATGMCQLQSDRWRTWPYTGTLPIIKTLQGTDQAL